jgi:homoserine dehydrogenase
MIATVRVAVAGCGTVGGALIDLLAQHGPRLERRSGARYELSRVLVRDAALPRSACVDRTLLTDDLDEFLETPTDVVVEAIGGTGRADAIARRTLARGRRLITANKALLRVAGPELAAIAHQHRHAGAALDFGAAVGGSVPVVRLLRESLAGHGLRTIRGVLNGTTNYILSRIERGATFDDALRAAQHAGFAEADPTRDLTGADAADKIAVLAWLGFGVDPCALDVRTRGLTPSIVAEVRAAARQDKVIRLVATAVRVSYGVHASVHPKVLHRSDPFAQVVDEQNLIQVESESSGTISISGRGAGGEATASALLADLLKAASPVPLLH